MPRYLKAGERKQWRYKNVHHLKSFLTRVDPKNAIWKKHFVQAAKNYKKKEPFLHPRSLRTIYTKHPVDIAGDLLSEMRQAQKGQNVGGGLGETLIWFSEQAANALGFAFFKEYVGLGYDHRDIPNEAQIFAKAVQATYFDKGKRPKKIETLTRIPEYDTDRCSVWMQPNGQYLVTLHGTKVNFGDISKDLAIAAGNQMSSPEVQRLFDRLDKEGVTYDIASHSLGTQFAVNGTHKNVDKIYNFNPASSPVMEGSYLTDLANNEAYTNFVNPSDGVSEAIWQKMTDETIDRSYVAKYTYSPLASHSISQWYPDLDEPEEEEDEPVDPHTEVLRDASENFRTYFADSDSFRHN